MELLKPESIKYVGGPREGQTRYKTPKDLSFPPSHIGCWEDIPLGSQVGIYRLNKDVNPPVMTWYTVRPARIKTHEDARLSSRG